MKLIYRLLSHEGEEIHFGRWQGFRLTAALLRY